MKAVVSIHDLMPETMDRVENILEWLKMRSIPPVTLLVVPGKPWTPRGIERLRQLAEAGHEMAAHGWRHETVPRRFWHRIHASLISRNVAEHLDLCSADIATLMCRANQWFAEQKLPPPKLYVPPAWALGTICSEHLAQLPYSQVETTRGILQFSPEGIYKMQLMPVSGYEADTILRATFLRSWNAYQAISSKVTKRPLRISIHPNDLNLRLKDQLDLQIGSVEEFIRYDALGS